MVFPEIRHVDEGSVWLETSLAIGRSLMQAAQRGKRRIGWTGDDLAGSDAATARVVHVDVGPGLYAGSAGIGWFLAQLGAAGGGVDMARTGVAALSTAVAVGQEHLDASSLSLFSGASGAALAAAQVAARQDRPALRRSALSLARRIAARLVAGHFPEEADLIGGLAGIVVALSALHRMHPDPGFVDACRVACERLVQTRREDLGGTCWPDAHAADSAPGLCGLGHGASGVAWALQEGAEITGDSRFAEVAADAFGYERSWFVAAESNWPDLRNPPPVNHGPGWPASMTAWCHGAIGIGALRWLIYERSGDMAALVEATASIHAARALTAEARRDLNQGKCGDTSLCHGLGGAVELLLLAYEVTGQQEHRRAAQSVGRLCLDTYHANQDTWTTGLAGARQVPGLMPGLAGIGTTMLRLHDHAAIGSPLLPGRFRA
jgi:lantibiotic modifying enzyme